MTGTIFEQIRSAHASLLHRAVVAMSPRLEVTDRTLLVIAPHQDDETLGCGGLIALKRARDVPVHVVFITDGSRSHGDADENDELVRTRQDEARRACDHLGVPQDCITFWHEPDGKLHRLAPGDREQLATRLADLIVATGAEEVAVPHERDRHLDHEAVSVITMHAVRGLERPTRVLRYAIWMPWRSPMLMKLRPAYLRGPLRLDLGASRSNKLRAIGCYRTQLDVLPAGFVRRFRQPTELYFERAD